MLLLPILKRHLVRLFLLASSLLLFYGCNQSAPQIPKPVKSAYIAISGTDTAWLNLTVAGTSFKGTCAINFSNSYLDSGTVRGRLYGDTLLGDFHYLHYGLEWKRESFALLKRNNTMIMGEGDQGFYFGIPYFKPDSPLQFDSVKFVFRRIKGIR
jgi:hypothetical protein